MPNSKPQPWSHALTVADLPVTGTAEFSLTPDAALCVLIAADLCLPKLRKIRFDGSLTPVGKSDWHLRARLGATAIQNCVITLEPVTTRIDAQIDRNFASGTVQDYPNELEMPEDVTIEALGKTIDVGKVMVEALALALPQFPRAPGAKLVQSQFTEPGQPPMSDADARPFAGLKSLHSGPKNNTG